MNIISRSISYLNVVILFLIYQLKIMLISLYFVCYSSIFFTCIILIVRYNCHSMILKIFKNMGSYSLMIQDIATIDRIDSSIGNLRMKEPSFMLCWQFCPNWLKKSKFSHIKNKPNHEKYIWSWLLKREFAKRLNVKKW